VVTAAQQQSGQQYASSVNSNIIANYQTACGESLEAQGKQSVVIDVCSQRTKKA